MVDNSLEHHIDTAKATISLIEEDIYCVVYKKDINLELEDFQQVKKIYKEWSKDFPLRILVDFPEFTSISQEARDFAEKNPTPAIAEAIVYKSLAQRLLVRFYLLVNKQQHPVRTFKSRV